MGKHESTLQVSSFEPPTTSQRGCGLRLRDPREPDSQTSHDMSRGWEAEEITATPMNDSLMTSCHPRRARPHSRLPADRARLAECRCAGTHVHVCSVMSSEENSSAILPIRSSGAIR